MRLRLSSPVAPLLLSGRPGGILPWAAPGVSALGGAAVHTLHSRFDALCAMMLPEQIQPLLKVQNTNWERG